MKYEYEQVGSIIQATATEPPQCKHEGLATTTKEVARCCVGHVVGADDPKRTQGDRAPACHQCPDCGDWVDYLEYERVWARRFEKVGA